MVQLLECDIRTTEVFDWKGLHLFHFHGSSCSQKLRVFLKLKGIQWEAHHVNLGTGENHSEFYLGINPRGLVPTLVIDGEIHIESNDIITLLDKRFPENRLIPPGMETQMAALLHYEDDLHLDLRTITFRFTQPRGKVPRSEERLQKFREGGSGTVQGVVDKDKDRELKFWESVGDSGITDDAVKTSAGRFKTTFEELEERLQQNSYLLGNDLTALDVAWVIYVNRLVRCGYPLGRLHPKLSEWFWPLRNQPEFYEELVVSPEIQKAVDEHHKFQRQTGTTLIDVAAL